MTWRIISLLFLFSSWGWAQTLEFMQVLELSQQNPSVVLAQGQVDLAQKQLEIAQGLVSGQLSAGYTQTWGEATTTLGEVETTTSLDDGSFDAINLSATFNVIPFGPNADNIQKAKWSFEEAQRNLRDVQSDAVVITVDSYLKVLRAQETVGLQTFAVTLASQQLEAARVRRTAGAITEQQVLQAEIALSQAQNNLGESERFLVQNLATLSNQLGVKLDGVDAHIPEGILPAYDLDLAIQNRSDVIKAKTAIQEAELTAESTKRQYLPSGSLDLTYASSNEDSRFSLSAGYDTQSYQPNLGLSYDPSTQTQVDSSSSFSLTLGAKIPIETSIFPALEAARLSIEQSQMQASRVEELARLEVENTLRQLEAAKANLDLSLQLLSQSQQTYETIKERLELGVVTNLDALESEKALLEAQLNLDKAKDSYLLSLLQVAQSLAINLTEVF